MLHTNFMHYQQKNDEQKHDLLVAILLVAGCFSGCVHGLIALRRFALPIRFLSRL